jgi:RNA polymerase sigma factor (sigma-70 family)
MGPHCTDVSNESDAAALRFTALYDEHAPRVLLYSARHVGAGHADDVVSEVFTVAWRRLDTVPDDGPLPWLLVVARNVIANRRRREGTAERTLHHAAVLVRLDAVTPDIADAVAERGALITALGDLTEREREAVLLVGWDGLSSAEAARVAGCSSAAFHVRLHRARRRLDRSLHPGADAAEADDGPGSTRSAATTASTTEATP